MINLENLNRQHNAIMEEISLIESEIRKGSSIINVSETALHISKLAGLLKIHSIEEDKFLYPSLLKCHDEVIRNLAKLYVNEMGNLATLYKGFRDKYNVSSKINKDLNCFLSDGKQMMEVLKGRIKKEDEELYYLVKNKGL